MLADSSLTQGQELEPFSPRLPDTAWRVSPHFPPVPATSRTLFFPKSTADLFSVRPGQHGTHPTYVHRYHQLRDVHLISYIIIMEHNHRTEAFHFIQSKRGTMHSAQCDMRGFFCTHGHPEGCSRFPSISAIHEHEVHGAQLASLPPGLSISVHSRFTVSHRSLGQLDDPGSVG